jgi:hypothetical protein
MYVNLTESLDLAIALRDNNVKYFDKLEGTS